MLFLYEMCKHIGKLSTSGFIRVAEIRNEKVEFREAYCPECKGGDVIKR